MAPALVTLANAEAYMLTRFAADAWSNLASDAIKEQALSTAENQLEAMYDMPTELADMTTAQNEAVYEQALFLAQNPGGFDSRAALQAQKVKSAGTVKEVYEGGAEIPICVFAQKLLEADKKPDLDAASANLSVITRDENA